MAKTVYHHPTLGERRTFFAWRPTRLWWYNPPYIFPSRFVWLRKVTFMWTLNGWVAYEDDQH